MTQNHANFQLIGQGISIDCSQLTLYLCCDFYDEFFKHVLSVTTKKSKPFYGYL